MHILLRAADNTAANSLDWGTSHPPAVSEAVWSDVRMFDFTERKPMFSSCGVEIFTIGESAVSTQDHVLCGDTNSVSLSLSLRMVIK